LKNKKAFTLLELLFSIVIGSIILVSSLSVLDLLYQENRNSFQFTLSKIDFETTRLFLEKKISTDQDLEKLYLDGDKVLYDGNLLLEKIVILEKKLEGNFIHLKICLHSTNEFCTQIYIKKY